jgi:hypothetical protein
LCLPGSPATEQHFEILHELAISRETSLASVSSSWGPERIVTFRVIVRMLLRLALRVVSFVLYLSVLLPAGILMLISAVAGFAAIATFVIAGATKLLSPHTSVMPEISAAVFVLVGAALLAVVVQCVILLNSKIRVAITRL